MYAFQDYPHALLTEDVKDELLYLLYLASLVFYVSLKCN